MHTTLNATNAATRANDAHGQVATPLREDIESARTEAAPIPESADDAGGARGEPAAKKRKGRSNPIFALYLAKDCLEPLERLIEAMRAPAMEANVDGGVGEAIGAAGAARKSAPGARRRFAELLLARVGVLRPEHLAAMPVSGRARGMNLSRVSFSVSQEALDAASDAARALGVSLQDAARAMALAMLRRRSAPVAVAVDQFLRAHTRSGRAGAGVRLVGKPIWCEPGLRERFDAACAARGVPHKAAYALAFEELLAVAREGAKVDANDDTSPQIERAKLREAARAALGHSASGASGALCWSVYATEADFASLDQAAAAAGVSRAQLLRGLLADWTQRADAGRAKAQAAPVAAVLPVVRAAASAATSAEKPAEKQATPAATAAASPVATPPVARADAHPQVVEASERHGHRALVGQGPAFAPANEPPRPQMALSSGGSFASSVARCRSERPSDSEPLSENRSALGRSHAGASGDGSLGTLSGAWRSRQADAARNADASPRSMRVSPSSTRATRDAAKPIDLAGAPLPTAGVSGGRFMEDLPGSSDWGKEAWGDDDAEVALEGENSAQSTAWR